MFNQFPRIAQIILEMRALMCKNIPHWNDAISSTPGRRVLHLSDVCASELNKYQGCIQGVNNARIQHA
jgi:hypothetical protein